MKTAMKINLVYFLIILFASSSCAQSKNEKKEWGEWELFGTIKSVVEISYNTQKESDKSVNGQQMDSVYFLFNSKGEEIEFIRASRSI